MYEGIYWFYCTIINYLIKKKREEKLMKKREEYKLAENDSNYILKYKQIEKKLETYKHDFKNISNYLIFI